MNSIIRVGGVDELSIPSESVCEFYKNNWERKISLGIFSFYTWQFRLPPENKGHDCCCIAVDNNNEILGVMGLNKRGFYLNGKLCKGAELTTWVVSEKARGKGVGGKIMHFLQSRYDVLAGMGITEAAIPIYLKCGFRFLRFIPRFVRVFDQSSVSQYCEINNLSQRLISKWSKSNVYSYSSMAVNPSELDSLEGYLKSNFNHFIRNSSSLSWRYENHPVFRYESYIVKGSGDGVGIVFRIEDLGSIKIVHITDFFGDRNDFAAGLSFINEYCLDNGIGVADFYCPSPILTSHFTSAGWFSTLDDYYFQFMHLFHPPELRSPPTTSVIYWARNDMLNLLDTSKLYITKEDMDLDRPTVEYIVTKNSI